MNGQETGAAATGRQFTIRNGGAEVTVTELAAALRTYRRQGVDLVEPFSADELPPSGSGILMAPWGNRVRDGKWVLEGKVQQLDLTEPSRGNATHGLLRNTGYTVADATAEAVSLVGEIFPQHGFPFRMRHTATYSLDADGHLAVRQELANLGPATAPAAFGAHPYLRLGDVPVEDLVLTVRGRRRLVADERLIPVGEEDVDGDTDFRAGKRVGDVRVDVAVTALEAGPDGRYQHVLTAPDGRRVALWADRTFPFAHIFVTENYRNVPLAVAVEPMSAPANALNSGNSLAWLETGESLAGTWGIRSWL
ncbi:aldose 1-epimerase [Zafaria cholistanensis]|uniref:Aldose 1-epimerase n=1 Tax=Zafaria cholistanensis TaxID=1682741 RepID=A0A5A7NTF6_9MICC|nr:aldose 1-epimerase family protein [Zafaria cholistanensis]GER23866.1 aldose 1-epimerase [Zafaria cholistanensis]